ncbi:unnamed protein product [Cercospora beticola]|nr:unnamed protein product [Cercospora beticola]
MRFFGPGVLCLLISGINASPVKPAVSPRDVHLDHEAFLEFLNPRGTLDRTLEARQIKDKKPNGHPCDGNSEDVAACRIGHLRMKGCDVNSRCPTSILIGAQPLGTTCDGKLTIILECISAVAWRGGYCASASAQGGSDVTLDLACLESIPNFTGPCTNCDPRIAPK